MFIMNHLSHFDWMFFWGVVEKQGDLHFWKVVTKDEIIKLPFIGKFELLYDIPFNVVWPF